jgi:ABC-type Fe3+-hydroxamate transport system substrate-binding protein
VTHRTLLLACLLAAGCRSAPPTPAAVTFEDPEGRPVTFNSLPVARIVSTNQAATEWLLALGAGGLLVARTDYDRQPELAHLPSIGGGLETSAEAVAALVPDVLLGWRIRASIDLARALQPFGIPVVAVEATDTTQAFHQLYVLAQLTGREARADTLAAQLRAELATLRQQHCPDGAATESVMSVLGTEPPQTAGGGTWMSELLGVACLRNAFEEVTAAWPVVSLEAITARQPHWILTSRGEAAGQRLAEFRAKPVWRDLEAVRAGRILELDGDLFARVGPGMADWVRALVAEVARVRGEG